MRVFLYAFYAIVYLIVSTAIGIGAIAQHKSWMETGNSINFHLMVLYGIAWVILSWLNLFANPIERD